MRLLEIRSDSKFCKAHLSFLGWWAQWYQLCERLTAFGKDNFLAVQRPLEQF